jgi:hypothetical protein
MPKMDRAFVVHQSPFDREYHDCRETHNGKRPIMIVINTTVVKKDNDPKSANDRRSQDDRKPCDLVSLWS